MTQNYIWCEFGECRLFLPELSCGKGVPSREADIQMEESADDSTLTATRIMHKNYFYDLTFLHRCQTAEQYHNMLRNMYYLDCVSETRELPNFDDSYVKS